MTIILRKFPDKPNMMTCLRDDGTETWQSYGNQSEFFAIHDLTHYAVETELDFSRAFFGLIAAGRDISDFGPGDEANLPAEAIQSEMLSGILTTTNGIGCDLTYDEICNSINGKLSELGIGSLPLSENQLLSIRQRANQYVADWREIEPNGKMILKFPSEPRS